MARAPRFTTPTGVAVYPRLHEADTKFKAAGEFSLKLRLSGEPAETLKAKLTAVHDEFYQAEQTKAGKKKKLKRCDPPFKAAVDQEGNETEDTEFKFSMIHNVTPKDGKAFTQKPALFDAKGMPCSVVVWGGSEVKVSYEQNLWNTALGVGLSLRLKAVQILKLVTSNGGSADSYGFGEEPGGYEAEPATTSEDAAAVENAESDF